MQNNGATLEVHIAHLSQSNVFADVTLSFHNGTNAGRTWDEHLTTVNTTKSNCTMGWFRAVDFPMLVPHVQARVNILDKNAYFFSTLCPRIGLFLLISTA